MSGGSTSDPFPLSFCDVSRPASVALLYIFHPEFFFAVIILPSTRPAEFNPANCTPAISHAFYGRIRYSLLPSNF